MTRKDHPCIGNWKANGTPSLLESWAKSMAHTPARVVLCPPHTLLERTAKLLDGFAEVGAQDVAPHGSGSHTGNVTAAMAADCGARWALVGHSERRAMGETDGQIATKLVQCADAGLIPVLCVGEDLEAREAGRLEAVLQSQVDGALGPAGAPGNLVVAYEPVWAIGTGKAADAPTAASAITVLRGLLAGHCGSARIEVLYGGSVNDGNASGYMAETEIDGLLVGGASLKAEQFAAIGKAVAGSHGTQT